MDALAVRNQLVDRLKADLVGPLDPTEVLESRPSDIYLTGILWPLDARMGGEEDDARADDAEGDPASTPASLVGQQRPCSMGVSFATASESAEHEVNITVNFGLYSPKLADRQTQWCREQVAFSANLRLVPGVTDELRVPNGEPSLDVRVHFRTMSGPTGLLSTVTLVNRSEPAESDRESVERLTVFQAHLVIAGTEATVIVPRPTLGHALDADEESARLLYRECYDFAAGHQCSVEWDAQGPTASFVATTWLPQARVPSYSDKGDPVFHELVRDGRLEASALASASSQELVVALSALVEAYGQWAESLEALAKGLDDRLRPTAERHIQECLSVRDRLAAGVTAIVTDWRLRAAFQAANAAMARQHSWKLDSEERPLGTLAWRPFQLGFILLAAESSCRRGSAEREVLDLLWFPTGGGKTEAYLALVAMVAVYRRLREDHPDDGAGNASLMRYTLRLLTAQQFERATAMVLALELIRRGALRSTMNASALGSVPFSAGLWVGGDATPNTFDKADASAGADTSSAEQIELCHACHRPLKWDYDRGTESVHPYCEGDDCELGSGFGPWPVFTVDSDVFRERPTLVIGTVDKFAQLPFQPRMADLFGLASSSATDLIIQDELHLIAGPLGTMVGLYETAFDWLLSSASGRPKIVGSAATIRRASDQVRAVFDRDSCQFPPPGLDFSNSGFAIVDPDLDKGRLYLAVTTAGRSAKFTLQAVAGSLLQSSGPTASAASGMRDGYSTLLAYFNSLRELGAAIVQVLDDVPDSIYLYAKRRAEERRELDHPRELTSGVAQREIVAIMSALKRTCDQDGAVDVVLATNMVSVGMDIPRLALMLVNGQPKTRAEYIQSTSRVGRAASPGLVVSVLNAAKARDRSHFETFPSWHGALYRDVEATSVTPFASRARDKALRAVLVSMVRHSIPGMEENERASLSIAATASIDRIWDEIQRRISSVDPKELTEAVRELDGALLDWEDRQPSFYHFVRKPRQSLMQYAETFARKVASGRRPGTAWPTMNNMRNVEPATRFRIVESLAGRGGSHADSNEPDPAVGTETPRWRRARDG